jgi:hypothetical protein
MTPGDLAALTCRASSNDLEDNLTEVANGELLAVGAAYHGAI